MVTITHLSIVVYMKIKIMRRGGERAWYTPSVHALIFVLICPYSMTLDFAGNAFFTSFVFLSDAKLLDYFPRGTQCSIVQLYVYCHATRSAWPIASKGMGYADLMLLCNGVQ